MSSINSVGVGGSSSSALGTPTTTAAGAIAIGNPTNVASPAGTLIYTGTGETTNRQIIFSAYTSSSTIENNGTGPLDFTNTAWSSYNYAGGSNANTALGGYNLSGSYTGANTLALNIGWPSGVNPPLTKSGPGTWILTGNNSYGGNTFIQQGTLSVGTIENTGVACNLGEGPVSAPPPLSTWAAPPRPASCCIPAPAGPLAKATVRST